jgi:drug/metabolite transporter (DMT)-like permease
MRKKTIGILYVLSILCSVVAVILFLVARFLGLQGVGTGVSVLLVLAASVLGVIAWIGVLIKQGKQEQWGWFICTLLFGGIVLLIYLIAVPENSPQLPLPGYGQVYQPQPPTQPPS